MHISTSSNENLSAKESTDAGKLTIFCNDEFTFSSWWKWSSTS